MASTRTAPEPEAGLSEPQLRALAAVTRSVAGAHELKDVLEVAAEETRAVLGVSALAISRWHLDAGRLQTLINVGELAPGEERWPQDETYALTDFPMAHALLRRGKPHLTSVDDERADGAERALLRRLGRQECAAVPIVYDGGTWGEMYVANAPGAPRLTQAAVTFMAAICAQIAVAIGRAELFSDVLAAAYRDPLTGLANRRALEERLGELTESAADGVALLLGDVDGLKVLNDRDGHEEGDRALKAVGRALQAAARPGLMAARVGGDEFCVLLERSSRAAAERLAGELSEFLAVGEPAVAMSWGVADEPGPLLDATALMRAADAAQYAAKRGRPGADEAGGTAVPSPGRRRHRDADLRTAAELSELLGRLRAELDERARGGGAHDAELARVAAEAQERLRALLD